MTLRSSLGPLAVSLLVSMLAVACGGTSISEAEDGAEPEEQEGELASCKYPKKYFATVREGSCTEVQGRRGRWVPEPLFSDVPVEVQTGTCAYVWKGERYARVDREALLAAFPEDEFPTRGAVTPACGSATPAIGALRRIPHVDIIGQAGSVGCDVCGIVRRGGVWVILPPERIGLRQVAVPLTNGGAASFQLEPPAGARAVSFELPPPPAGSQYQDGRIWVY
jgi:hypothetical protein